MPPANVTSTGSRQIAGDNFTASYGGSDPVELWTTQEAQGDKPMYWLLSILDLPYGTIDTEQGTLYVWPSAYAHQGSWETTPEADVEALRSLYSDERSAGLRRLWWLLRIPHRYLGRTVTGHSLWLEIDHPLACYLLRPAADM